MNQKALYEQQLGVVGRPHGAVEPAILRRNHFVANYVGSSFPVHRGQLKVLELSVGDGTLTEELITSVPDVCVTGVDISPARLSFVKQRIQQHRLSTDVLNLIECNLDTDFDAIDGCGFHVAIALDIMEHVFDVFNFVRQCHRVLKPGGKFILRVPNIAFLRHRVGLLFGNIPVTASWYGPRNSLQAWEYQHGWDGGHLHLFTIPILLKLLREQGFEVQNVRDPGTRFESFRNVWPNLLYSNPVIVCNKR
jgi:cyclopropane fatty-acyl-phospholipid synthase-like methyltransferase